LSVIIFVPPHSDDPVSHVEQTTALIKDKRQGGVVQSENLVWDAEENPRRNPAKFADEETLIF
jgi:hypothetical protein